MKSTKLAKGAMLVGLAGGGAAGFALGLPGVSGAQTSTTPTPTTPTAPAARPDREAKMRETLKPLVDNATITQAQLDAVVGALKAASPADLGGRGGHQKGGGGADITTAATAIGVTEAELRTAVQGGQSIAAFAQSKGVDPQKVIDALVAAMKTRLAESVTAGKITQAQADELAANAATRVAEMVNGTAPLGRGPGGGGRGHR